MLILTNAHIYTLDSHQPTANALAIDSGHVVAVGTEEFIRNEFRGRGKVLDLNDLTVIPGLTDSHLHLKHYALSLQKVDCETASLAECLQRVAERVEQTPAGEWVLGHGWNQNEWPDVPSEGGMDGFPSAVILDKIAPDHPVFLTAKSLHASWANTAALRLAGITAQTLDPENGQIQRDARGEPTGILLEGASGLVSSVIPQPEPDQILQAMRVAQKTLWGMGLTGVHDFDRRDSFIALQTLHGRRELGLRVVKTIPVEDLVHAIGVGLRSGFGDDFLRIGMVKAFADGALGPHTAAMFQPYADEPENRGMLLLDSEEIMQFGRQAVENGLGLTIHAIGDRANHEVLNAYAGLREHERALGLPHLRHRIEHVQILHPDDFPRLAELGVIASMQPIHATSDMIAADRFWGERSQYGYAWRELLYLDTPMAFGSDAPVDSPNPFWGLYAAVTRRRADGSPGPEGWYPDQRLTRLEAFQGYTTGAAFAAGMENRLGLLSPGFLADLLVLDTDPFTCEPDALRDIRPVGVMVGGEWKLEIDQWRGTNGK
ncbi:MAG TPA: amidohydrolase [Anaerolineales bacterium]|nr:amidohydrolase [Anaerolineales bacterium]